ncbi:hypothetical protein KIH31_14455 [Paenarthrobacter sp. DKR-5]|uniref:hypothetical protein n=1 Tax=Paenarthrobacter sp. DKR-5 TaxID=2835535 RepID=UPI001BDC8DA6|nr:hypothetical protein [Paenarthrobacter sp. DKR-5]MBT1003802.1 hypothetical protein [Paenarthrobacter sp. DKR-5]
MDLNEVREGMDVFDAAGKKVGKVRTVRAGDPDAVPDEGRPREGDLPGWFAHLFSEAQDLPDEERQHLVREGYIQVNAPGFEQDFYEESGSVDRVEGDAVYLNITHHH